MKLARMMRFAAKLPTHRFTGVDLILTRRCNLACPYCGVIRGEKKPELTPDAWKRIIDYFHRNRHLHFIFTGGEALLYDGLPELVAHASPKALTCLMSNGKDLSAERLSEMPGLDFLTVSLDPPQDELGSGKYGFDRLDELKAYAEKSGLSISCMATVTRQNVTRIPELVRRLKPYGFPFLMSLYHYGSSGQYDFRHAVEALSFPTHDDAEALEAMARDLIAMKRQGYLIGETEWYLESLGPFVRGEAVTHCRAGIDWFEVDSDGHIKACHDAPPSPINALDEPDYADMKRRVMNTRPLGCRCMYDFYFNARYLREKPIRYLAKVWSSRAFSGR